MANKSWNEAIKTYADILQEINLRIFAINHCAAGKALLAPPFVKEFCYLQIRMICELVALGCLVAHGDVTQASSKKLQGEWSADLIMKTLENLHPNFYPQAVKMTKTANGQHLQGQACPLTKQEFLRLYHNCGEVLHRGSLRKLLSERQPAQTQFPDVTKKAQKLMDLLANHILVMQNGEQAFIAILQSADLNFKPQVAIIETPPQMPMDYKSPDFLRDPA